MAVRAPEIVELPAYTDQYGGTIAAHPAAAEAIEDVLYTLRFDEIPLTTLPDRNEWHVHRVEVPRAGGGAAVYLLIFHKTPPVEAGWSTPPFTLTLAGLIPV